MFEILFVSAAMLGAILGSFINALLFRFNTGKGMSGRSRCLHCGHTLSLFDLVPIFSYIFLRGRCRFCQTRISLQYPLVEITAALLAALTFLEQPDLLRFSLWLLVWMILLFAIVYDLRHKIIPFSASILLIGLSLLILVIESRTDILSLLAGPALAAPLFLFSLVSQGRWMGWGDGLLELSFGWLLGVTLGLTALMLAFWSGALVGIVLILWGRALPAGRQVTMKSEVPFAPFLALGAATTHFFHVDFFTSLVFLF